MNWFRILLVPVYRLDLASNQNEKWQKKLQAGKKTPATNHVGVCMGEGGGSEIVR